MSAGVCGKRVGFEEIFGSSSTPCSAAKRSRYSSFGSPIRSSELGCGSEDRVLTLLQMFPALDRELVETVLRTHKDNIEDAIRSLKALCIGDGNLRNESQSFDSTMMGNCATVPDLCQPGGQMSQPQIGDEEDSKSTIDSDIMDGSKWVDIFVQEMMNAADLDDARGRAARMLEAFERSVTANSRASKELEHVSLREHLQSLLRDNQILKRAVAIQHERNLEQEEKTKEVQQLKHMLCQYQEQLRNLELSNYTLKLHLQRAQESSCIPGQFHPDIF
ncbi:uncharacterized protein LOC131160039 isoform X2 [Malania oleifera]|uniref:uncharacterized protein LOC131160039 isoform X2 n=1 Tax=Malania oleifera TaxID=397392 RepID=UPI0025AE4286|nr:uncharacterized protein LOC131160039 isoform X2 [Malania oleifera]